jgi:hypothetical protein
MSARGRDNEEPMAGEELVSLLYGELGAAEDADARARVSSDPDLAARMDGMRRVRDLFSVMEDEDPPPRLSAQLMAEAARSAPRAAAPAASSGDGFWARLVSWLQPLTQRPALAAAASLVLVGGVAGVLYMRKGDDLTSSSRPAAPAAASADTATVAPPAAPAPEPAPAAEEEAPAMDEGGAAAVVESDKGEKQRAPSKTARAPRARADEPVAKKAAPPKPSGVKSGTVLGLTEQEIAPPADADDAPQAGSGAASSPPPPPAAQPNAPGSAERAEPAPESKPPAQSKAPARPDVRDLHRRAVDAAIDRRCSEVRSLAGQVRQVDSGYYSKSFSRDGRLQSCLQSDKTRKSTK